MRLQSEIDATPVIREHTKVPVPRVFRYKIDGSSPAGVAFMLMEFLPGGVAIHADGGYEAHQAIFFYNRGGFYEAIAKSSIIGLFISFI